MQDICENNLLRSWYVAIYGQQNKIMPTKDTQVAQHQLLMGTYICVAIKTLTIEGPQ